METRRIGTLEVSVIGLGCNNFGGRIDEGRTKEVVDAALDGGINFFDTADIYGGTKSEELLGRALGPRRDEVIIATKFGMTGGDTRPGGASPEYVRESLEGSLKRLGTDWVDLYFVHQPDEHTPIADTLGALDEFVKTGKVREIGCSNFSVAQLREAEAAAAAEGAHFVALQNEYSLLKRDAERDVIPECEKLGIAFVPYFPLYNGLLTGKYRRGAPLPEGSRITNARPERQATLLAEENLDIVEALAAYADAHGHTLLDLAFARLLAEGAVASVIAGATAPEQVRANVETPAWHLSGEEIAEIDALAPLR